MTPKEKSELLVRDYYDQWYQYINDPIRCLYKAKKCAIICVEQIIEAGPYYFYPGRKVMKVEEHSTKEFWEEVLNRLKNS